MTGAPSGRWCAAYEDLIPALATAMRITCLQLTPQQVTSVANGISSPADNPVDGRRDRAVAVVGVPDLAGLRPEAHVVETWKLSTDPEFIAKVRDVVGLYMNPPSTP